MNNKHELVTILSNDLLDDINAFSSKHLLITSGKEDLEIIISACSTVMIRIILGVADSKEHAINMLKKIKNQIFNDIIEDIENGKVDVWSNKNNLTEALKNSALLEILKKLNDLIKN